MDDKQFPFGRLPFPGNPGFLVDGDRPVKLIPVHGDNLPDAVMDPKEFMHNTYKMTDAELNEFLYQQAKESVESGRMDPWPEDDFGTLIWFTFTFITPEMRKVFPSIAREFLANEKSLSTTEFVDMPYPSMQEGTWDDSYYFRILLMMVKAARRGSDYSRLFLISLYKVYYKSEYNMLKRFKKLTYLDLLNLHDADCKKKGYPSGHSLTGDKTFQQYVIEKREHEPGWTCLNGVRSISPIQPKKKMKEPKGLSEEEKHLHELYEQSADLFRSIMDSPEEPPLQPTSSRLFIMCEMLRIPIDETCNLQAVDNNIVAENALNLSYYNSPELRKITRELIDRHKEWLVAEYPEIKDPFEYQKNQDYTGLEMAEAVLWEAFRKYDRNIRLPYDSKKFDLPELVSTATVSLIEMELDPQITFREIQMLAMVQYLCECLCDLMDTRDKELNDLLHFKPRKHEFQKPSSPAEEEKFKGPTVSAASSTPTGDQQTAIDSDAEQEEKAEDSEQLRVSLAEANQKVIRQRTLYEEARERVADLEDQLSNAAEEHTELIALRDYVYSLQTNTEVPELDEATQEQMVADMQSKSVAVLGGTEKWTKRMKRLFPKWRFVPVEDDSIGGYNALESCSHIYIYTSALKHKVYYRAMNLIKKEGKALYFLGSSNIQENIVRMHRDLCEGELKKS